MLAISVAIHVQAPVHVGDSLLGLLLSELGGTELLLSLDESEDDESELEDGQSQHPAV